MSELKELLVNKGFDDLLIDFALKFYPIMCKNFGTERTDWLFKEYTFVPNNKFGAASGSADVNNRVIRFDWIAKNFHEANTLFIHEAGHATGCFAIEDDSNMLMEGYYYRESFFFFIEEALVSELQNQIEFGDVNYYNATINTFDEEEFHQNDFKSQGNKYTVYCAYYKLLKLLLGENEILFNKNKFAQSEEEASDAFNSGLKYIQNQLTKEEYLVLKDSIAVLIMNFSYSGNAQTFLERLNSETNKEEYTANTKKLFPKTFSYCSERNLLGRKIFDSIDDLCNLTIDVLIRRLNDENYDSFLAIKQASKYLVEVGNNSEKLKQKTNELKSLLLKRISLAIPNLQLPNLEIYGFDMEEKIDIITKIISLPEFDNLNAVVLFNGDGKNLSFNFEGSDNTYNISVKDVHEGNMRFSFSKPIGRQFVFDSNKYDYLKCPSEGMHK